MSLDGWRLIRRQKSGNVAREKSSHESCSKSTFAVKKASPFWHKIKIVFIYQTRFTFGALYKRGERKFPRKSRSSEWSLESPLSEKWGTDLRIPGEKISTNGFNSKIISFGQKDSEAIAIVKKNLFLRCEQNKSWSHLNQELVRVAIYQRPIIADNRQFIWPVWANCLII